MSFLGGIQFFLGGMITPIRHPLWWHMVTVVGFAPPFRNQATFSRKSRVVHLGANCQTVGSAKMWGPQDS